MNSRDSYPRLLIMRCFFPLPLGWSQRKKMESLDFYYCPAKKATTSTYQCHGRPHGNQKQGINIPVNQWDISRDLVGTLESHMHSAIMSRLPFPGLQVEAKKETWTSAHVVLRRWYSSSPLEECQKQSAVIESGMQDSSPNVQVSVQNCLSYQEHGKSQSGQENSVNMHHMQIMNYLIRILKALS